MPQQLIYTSAPRGIVAGRSGYCTVARSASMREALVLPLEKLCYYQHLSLSGGQERPIFACRIIDLRGTRYHVLTRIQDAGLDFTGRTNFVAHHLVFTPEEIKQFPTPPAILRDWPGWAKSWTKDAQLLETENWTDLIALAGKTNIPAQTWQRVTGDAINGYGLLEARAGASFRVDDQPTETVLGLFGESVELLEVRDARRDFRTTGWQFTFTTSIQEQDNPSDFRWRCIHSDNPAANRFAGPDCRALSSVRAGRCTPEETAFARSGRQPPRFVTEPRDVRLVEGEKARFQAKAEGIPQPIYQWFTVDRHDNGQIIQGQNGPDLTLAAPPLGKSRYVVRAINSAGEATTNIVTLSVEQRLRVAKSGTDLGDLREPLKVGNSYAKSGDEIERQRKRLQLEKAEELFHKRLRRNKIIVVILSIAVIASAGVFYLTRNRSPTITQPPVLRTNQDHTIIARVTATGSKPLIYQWYKDNDQISSATNAFLPLTDMIGSFFVVITNTRGSATSAVVSWAGLSAHLILQSAAPTTAAPAPPPFDSASPTNKSSLRDESRALPLPWISLPIGKLNVSTYARQDGDTFVVTGAGTNFYGREDECYFVYQTVTNFKEFSARLSLPVKAELPSNVSGLMLRESEKPDSPFVFIGVSSSTAKFCSRPSASVPCNTILSTEFKKSSQLYIKLSLEGSAVTGWFSVSNNFPTAITNRAIMPLAGSNCLIGFVVCSGSADSPATADFDKVSISPTSKSGN